MTNKLVVIINSLKVSKIKKLLLYEMKFLVPNYSCLQNPWLGGYAPRSPFSLSSVLNWICWTPPPKKILGTPLLSTLAITLIQIQRDAKHQSSQSWGYSSKSLQANAETAPIIRTKLLPSTRFPIHCSLPILPLDVTQYEILTNTVK